MPTAAKYDQTKFDGGLGQLQDSAKALNDALNPFSHANNGKVPFYATGARAFVKLGGRPMGVTTSIRWNISYNATPIHTVDSVFPWDIDVGSASITASLGQIMDPTKGPEADGLFAIMKAAVHQPTIELQVLDALGTSMFFARGMFTAVTGDVTKGQVGTWSCQFIGVAYQHYVAQNGFKPYSGLAGAVSGLVNGLAGLSSDLTGGIL
jgi:hypothetical protein